MIWLERPGPRSGQHGCPTGVGEGEVYPGGSPGRFIPRRSSSDASSLGGSDTSEGLLHRADQALYRAKREGRNRVIAEAA